MVLHLEQDEIIKRGLFMAASAPTLHIWHDYVCPFSYVAATRVQRLKDADGLNLDVRFHPWPLEVSNGVQPAAEEEDRWVRLLRVIEPAAFVGWNPSSGLWPAGSRLLFAAYEAARAQGSAVAERFDLLLRQAIFQQPRPIDSIEALSGPVAAAGLDIAAFRAMLEDGSAGRAAEAAGTTADSGRIRGIPTLVLPDGRMELNPGMKMERGGEGRVIRDDVEALRDMLRHAAAATADTTTV